MLLYFKSKIMLTIMLVFVTLIFAKKNAEIILLLLISVTQLVAVCSDMTS